MLCLSPFPCPHHLPPAITREVSLPNGLAPAAERRSYSTAPRLLQRRGTRPSNGRCSSAGPPAEDLGRESSGGRAPELQRRDNHQPSLRAADGSLAASGLQRGVARRVPGRPVVPVPITPCLSPSPCAQHLPTPPPRSPARCLSPTAPLVGDRLPSSQASAELTLQRPPHLTLASGGRPVHAAPRDDEFACHRAGIRKIRGTRDAAPRRIPQARTPR